MQEDPTLFIRASFRVLARNFYKLLGISILVAILGYGIAKQFPATYEVNFSYMVSMEQRDESSNFRYDGYYALSATDLFSATLAGVIVSPETIVAAYGGANIPLPTEDTIDLVKSIRMRQESLVRALFICLKISERCKWIVSLFSFLRIIVHNISSH